MPDIDKSKVYNVVFVHFLDDDDKVEETVTGRGFYRVRRFMCDLGYMVDSVWEVI